MHKTHNNCVRLKISSTTLRQVKTVAVIFQHSCLPIFCYILALVQTSFLLNFSIRAYFSLDKGSCYFFSTRNNCHEFLVPYGVINQSFILSYLKTPVCGASLSFSAKYQITEAYSIILRILILILNN